MGGCGGDEVNVNLESKFNTAVRKLRSALKDSPERPLFIETVPGKGCRFINSPASFQHWQTRDVGTSPEAPTRCTTPMLQAHGPVRYKHTQRTSR